MKTGRACKTALIAALLCAGIQAYGGQQRLEDYVDRDYGFRTRVPAGWQRSLADEKERRLLNLTDKHGARVSLLAYRAGIDPETGFGKWADAYARRVGTGVVRVDLESASLTLQEGVTGRIYLVEYGPRGKRVLQRSHLSCHAGIVLVIECAAPVDLYDGYYSLFNAVMGNLSYLVKPPDHGIRLAFNPPEGFLYEGACSRTIEITAEKKKKGTCSLKLGTVSRVVRAGDGYTLSVTLRDVDIRLDDKPIDERIAAFLSAVAVTCTLDAGGRVREVRGFEGLDALLEKHLGRSKRRLVGPFINEEFFVWFVKSRWQKRAAALFGKKMEPGTPFVALDEQYIMRKNFLACYSTGSVGEPFPCDNSRCVRLELGYTADAAAVAQAAQTGVHDVIETTTQAAPRTASLEGSAEGKGTVVIDTGTGIPRSEELSRSLRVLIEIPDIGKAELRITEQSSFTSRAETPATPPADTPPASGGK